MNDKIITDLVELGIYKAKTISEEEYDNLSENNTDDSLIYISGYYSNEDIYFKEVDTKGLSIDDIKLKLEIDRTKNIRSIKKMITFFVIITVISMIVVFFGGMSLMETLDKIR